MNIIKKIYPKNYLFLLLAFLLAGIDQIIKLAISSSMQPFDSTIVLPGFLRITYVQNTGAAFSIFEGKLIFLSVLTAAALLIAIFVIVSGRITTVFYLAPTAMLIGGGVGNLIDRIFRGYVIDYIDVTFWPFDGFAIFNFADCLVVIGTILLIIFILKDEFKTHKKDS